MTTETTFVYGLFHEDELSMFYPRCPEEEFETIRGAFRGALAAIEEGVGKVSIIAIHWSDKHDCFVEQGKALITIDAEGYVETLDDD